MGAERCGMYKAKEDESEREKDKEKDRMLFLTGGVECRAVAVSW